MPALGTAIADKDRDVRTAAIDALGAIGDPRALDALTTALKDEDAVIRRHAAAAIADVGGARGARATSVRRQAAWALGTIGG